MSRELSPGHREHGYFLPILDRNVPVPDETAAAAQTLKYRDDEVHADSVRVAYLWLPPTGVPGEMAPLVQVAETLDRRQRLAGMAAS